MSSCFFNFFFLLFLVDLLIPKDGTEEWKLLLPYLQMDIDGCNNVGDVDTIDIPVDVKQTSGLVRVDEQDDVQL
jgi:hypothetical protein